MSYIEGTNRNQLLLFPEVIDNYIEEDNIIRFIDMYVDNLDMIKLGFTHALPNNLGRNSYNPRDLLKLYLYGYFNKIRSSRKLERETHRNVELIWLMRQLKPDFKTIADFRKNNSSPIKNIFTEFVLLCKNLDLLDSDLIAVDGSKFKAVNSSNRCYSRNKVSNKLKEIEESIEQYMQMLNKADETESEFKTVGFKEAKEKYEALIKKKLNMKTFNNN